MNEVYYTVKEAATRLRRCPKTIWNLMSSRQLTFVKGRPALIPESAIKEFIRKRTKRAVA